MKWFLFLPIHLLVILNRYWLAWVAIKYFSTDDKLNLRPGWGWFMTIDNDLRGDSGWLTHITGDPLSDENRIGWLRRNGGNGLNYGLLGVPGDPDFIKKWQELEAKRRWLMRSDGA